MNNKLVSLIVAIFVLNSCHTGVSNYRSKSYEKEFVNDTKKINKLLAQLEYSNDNKIMVIAHRGDWRNAPENSIQAIENCIKMGVDMVEIDIRKTKDNKFIVIHDDKLDRTTTGIGYVSDWTLDSIKTLYLKNDKGVVTRQKVPTLEEALLVSKNKILVNLDKCYDYFDEVYDIIEETGTAKQVVIKGYNKSLEDVKSDLGDKLNSIVYMPIINLDKQADASDIIKKHQAEIKPKAFEFVFSVDTSSVLNNFSEIKKNGSKVWVNSLWNDHNAGHDDDLALKYTDSIYGWYVKKGINMIQTDRPKLLLKYLRGKGLHE